MKHLNKFKEFHRFLASKVVGQSPAFFRFRYNSNEFYNKTHTHRSVISMALAVSVVAQMVKGLDGSGITWCIPHGDYKRQSQRM